VAAHVPQARLRRRCGSALTRVEHRGGETHVVIHTVVAALVVIPAIGIVAALVVVAVVVCVISRIDRVVLRGVVNTRAVLL
jgi:hypothetical protein